MTAGRLVPLVLAVLVAGINAAAFTQVMPLAPPWLAWTILGPLLVGAAAATVASTPAPAPLVVTAPPPPPPETAALHLLGTLQEEGRLIDFLLEDVAQYSDEQIGAAVRGIHAPCRTALRNCLTIEPVMPGGEGDAVTVAAGFDPSSVRLVGNVHGPAPYSGSLRHSGWRVTAVRIPSPSGRDPRVLAPAEVELP